MVEFPTSMIPQPPQLESHRNAAIDFIATAIMTTGLGLLLWLVLLAVNFVGFVSAISKHAHEQNYHAPAFFISPYVLGTGYCACFLLAALLVSCWKWRLRPVTATFVGYAVYLVLYLPTLDWGRSKFGETIALFIPLLTAPLGAFLGESGFKRVRPARADRRVAA